MQNKKDQDSIVLGTHGENYGSWMSNPVFISFGAIAAVALILTVLFFAVFHVIIAGIIFAVITLVMLIVIIWCAWIRKQYSFSGGQIMQKVHKAVIENLDYDGEGTLLEVGCGAGPLSIRAALTWPNAKVVGIDYYGKDFGYTPEVCRENAALEGAGERCTFEKGDANKLEFEDESMDALISAYVYHNVMNCPNRQDLLLESLRVLKKGGAFVIVDSMKPKLYGDMDAFVKKLKDMGYEDVRLLNADELIFGSSAKAGMLMLGNARMLVGRK